MPQLSVEEIGKLIDQGGSVFVRDREGQLRHVTSRANMPTEADLAAGDAKMAQLALETSRRAGVGEDELGRLREEVARLVKEAEGRSDKAAGNVQEQIARLQADLARAQSAANAKPAPAPAPTPAHAPAAPAAPAKAPEVKAK